MLGLMDVSVDGGQLQGSDKTYLIFDLAGQSPFSVLGKKRSASSIIKALLTDSVTLIENCRGSQNIIL